MASTAPDPRTFKSWEDAFQYPIPVIRKLEQQLRSSANENREKLRSLVGASYRDLLDTAETIIDMEESMERVETKLARVGQNCNSRSIERIASNAGNMDIHGRGRASDRYSFASQLAILRNCPVVMARLLKSDSSYLLIAKVLVVSRLLHKSLSQSKTKPPIVDLLWDRLLSVRRKLLRRIDKRLASTEGDVPSLVESMCAYALVTSSTPTDVLQHFHKMRLEKMINLLQRGHDELAKHGIAALRLCIQTCQDTQTIFPRRLADSLVRLKAQPLIQDHHVRALYELNLDIHDRWIGDEARNYTPWPRHDELQRVDAERILHQWSKQAISTFLQHTKSALKNEDRLKEVASLRLELIEVWILSGSRMAGVKSANVLDDLRDTMNSHLEAIVRARSQNLKTVVMTIAKTLESWPVDAVPPDVSLWTTASPPPDRSNGAGAFKCTILNTHHGRDDSVIDVVSKFDAWMQSVLEVKAIVKSMKEARWDDTFADDVDDESDEDELGDSKQTLLSDDDPRLLEEVTQEALSSTLQNLGKGLGNIVKELTEDEHDVDIRQVCFVLRVMREITERIPKLRLQDKATPLASPFTSTLLNPLHTSLARQVIQPSSIQYEKALAKASKAKSKSHILWEGNPPLPAQPSPSAFTYLQTLNRTMGSYGSDLWASASVSILKQTAADKVSELLKTNLNKIEKLVIKSNSAGPHTKTEKASEKEHSSKTAISPNDKEAVAEPSALLLEIKNRKWKQALFDALYIQRFITVTTPVDNQQNNGAFGQLVREAIAKSGLDDAGVSRMKKSAGEYAKKTYLLFALLA
ncbi:hypothetical protein DM02DRAFT_656433 [Periconia macrospinosa]|uniref:Conserved oligomeric Golgi complex subunit 1 n=1 Tax=Periconia macrospinosa TaxID=97972 RepID=A0A2V1DMW7_9PLEO|nr:hypothetical protein DM02DRAFT_656433 [Periconia macrospinosa]